MIPDLSIASLLRAYREGTATPEQIIIEAWQRAATDDAAIWISPPHLAQLRECLRHDC